MAAAHDVFLAFDEVQTPGGQCGSLFALDLFDLPYPPEAVAVAKKFGNGVLYMRQSLRDIGVLDSAWAAHLRTWCASSRSFASLSVKGRFDARHIGRIHPGPRPFNENTKGPAYSSNHPID